MTFIEWILADTNPSRAPLRDYVARRKSEFEIVADLEQARGLVQSDGALSPDERAAHEANLADAWVLRTANGAQPTPKGKWAWFYESLPFILMGVIVFLAIGVLATVLWPRTQLLHNLGQLEIARGLITFVFTFGVIFVTLILLIGLFGSQHPDVTTKFDRAKELFTAMIAVLGTILGFYFGEASGDRLAATVEAAEGASPQADTVLLGLERLGIATDELDLTDAQLAAVAEILDGNAADSLKRTEVERILGPGAAEGSVVPAVE